VGRFYTTVQSVVFTEGVLGSDVVLDYHEGGRDLLARYLIVGGSEDVRGGTYEPSMHMARVFGHGIPLYDRLTRPEEVALGRASTLTEAAARQGMFTTAGDFSARQTTFRPISPA